MSQDNRSGVLSGEDIALRVLVLDDRGYPRNTDALPELYIYDSTVDTDDILDEMEAETYVSALAGPFTATLISTGFYEYTYTVPSGSAEGTWRDVWVAELDTVSISNIRSFTVITGADFELQSLSNNEMVLITLDASIASSADPEKTLSEDLTLSFSTVYRPFYSSVELVRSEGGPLISWLPDDTIALLIHWASKEVDAIKPRKLCGDKFPFWRTKFVMLDTALKAAGMPGGAYVNGLDTGRGGSKSLGELSIKDGGSSVSGTMSGGIDSETYSELKKLRDEVWRVVNAGGCINPGQSLGFAGALRGLYDPARRLAGRQWLDPAEYHYAQPTGNSKVRRPGERMGRFADTKHRKRFGRGYTYTRSGRYYYD